MRNHSKQKRSFRPLTDALEKVAGPSSLAPGIVSPELLTSLDVKASIFDETAFSSGPISQNLQSPPWNSDVPASDEGTPAPTPSQTEMAAGGIGQAASEATPVANQAESGPTEMTSDDGGDAHSSSLEEELGTTFPQAQMPSGGGGTDDGGVGSSVTPPSAMVGNNVPSAVNALSNVGNDSGNLISVAPINGDSSNGSESQTAGSKSVSPAAVHSAPANAAPGGATAGSPNSQSTSPSTATATIASPPTPKLKADSHGSVMSKWHGSPKARDLGATPNGSIPIAAKGTGVRNSAFAGQPMAKGAQAQTRLQRASGPVNVSSSSLASTANSDPDQFVTGGGSGEARARALDSSVQVLTDGAEPSVNSGSSSTSSSGYWTTTTQWTDMTTVATLGSGSSSSDAGTSATTEPTGTTTATSWTGSSTTGYSTTIESTQITSSSSGGSGPAQAPEVVPASTQTATDMGPQVMPGKVGGDPVSGDPDATTQLDSAGFSAEDANLDRNVGNMIEGATYQNGPQSPGAQPYKVGDITRRVFGSIESGARRIPDRIDHILDRSANFTFGDHYRIKLSEFHDAIPHGFRLEAEWKLGGKKGIKTVTEKKEKTTFDIKNLLPWKDQDFTTWAIPQVIKHFHPKSP